MPDPVSLLFVPGDRPDRFPKAMATGADRVVLDLEDAVAPSAKAAARANVEAWLGAAGPVDLSHVVVRINPGGEAARLDMAALAAWPVDVMVPKAEDPDALSELRASLHPESRLLALVETAAGVVRATEIARVTGVERLVLGTFDLAAQLGVSPDHRDAMLGARHALVLASAAAGLAPPVDGVTGNVADLTLLEDDLAHALGLGFGGKLCIHPRQVPVVRSAFLPSPDEVAWARKVLGAAGEADRGAVLVDGAMVDAPVVLRAERIVARVPQVPD